MPSFDVVSRVDFQEIDNAIANALREITNRYDFKGSNTTCLLYTSPSPRDRQKSRMPSSA